MSGRVFWSDERLQRVGVALLIALTLACSLWYATDSEGISALRRGDFPGIYSPAVLVAQGQAERLYDLKSHHEVQKAIWPSFANEMYISVYPPYFGILLVPLAYLEPETARNVWTLISLVCYLAALYLLRPLCTVLRENLLFIAICLLLLPPFLFGVLGGQNSAMSLLLLVAGTRLLARRSVRTDFLAGLVFGLWLFKPQFGVLAGVYLLLTRRVPALMGYVLVALFYWLIGARVLGVDWIAHWLTATKEFAAINFNINDFQMASFAGFLSSLTRLGVFEASAVLPLSIVLSVALLAFIWRSGVRSAWMLGPIAVLISPQTLFYDVSIALVSCLPFISFKSDREVNSFVFCSLGIAVLFFVRDYSRISLPFFVALAAFAFIFKRAAIMKHPSFATP